MGMLLLSDLREKKMKSKLTLTYGELEKMDLPIFVLEIIKQSYYKAKILGTSSRLSIEVSNRITSSGKGVSAMSIASFHFHILSDGKIDVEIFSGGIEWKREN